MLKITIISNKNTDNSRDVCVLCTLTLNVGIQIKTVDEKNYIKMGIF